MSVRKLSQRLREHDWFAALIELVIVIVGILIALQVSNWNQDRVERRLAQEYVERLHDELRTDLRNMASTRRFWAQVVGYQKVALRNAETGELAHGSAWETLLAYYQSSQLRPFELGDTTFAELRDAGELRLLADPDLRKGLADYYRNTGEGMIGEILRHNPVYRMQIRGVTPYEVQEYIWAKCWKQLEGADQLLIDCPSPISEDAAAAIVANYRSNDSLRQNLLFWHTQMHVSTLIVTGVETQARTLDARVLALRSKR